MTDVEPIAQTEPDRPTESPENVANLADAGESSDDTQPRLVSVSEAIRYRKRAQVAERELSEVRARLDSAEAECREVQQRLTAAERRAAIDGELIQAGAVDMHAARLLVGAALDAPDAPGIGEVVETMRRERPQLFRTLPGAAVATAAMGPAIHADKKPGREIQRAAHEARQSGHNADVMRYMSLRRSASS